MKSFIKKVVTRSFNAIGLDIVRQGHARRWGSRMRHAKELGFSPKAILDGGAFRGLWAKDAAEIFPGAQLVVVEPNPALQEIIARNVSGIDPLPKIVEAALGETPGTAPFNIWHEADADQGASLLDHVSGKAGKVVDVNVETLDGIAERLAFKPDLLKLDLQGGELAALNGGQEVLRHAELVLVEFGCLEAYVGRTTPRQLIDKMYDSGFCLYDIVDMSNRPYDGALTGGDFIFIKTTSALRSHKGWE